MTTVHKISLTELNRALDRGDLITKELTTVSKNGCCTWTCCPSSAQRFRLVEVVGSLHALASRNARSFTPEMREAFDQIREKLKQKVYRSSHMTASEKAAVKALLDSRVMRPVVRHLDSPVPSLRVPLNAAIAPGVVGDNQERVRRALVDFANELCARISKSDGSSVSFSLSPVSILAALGMVLHMINPHQKRHLLEIMGLSGLRENEAHEAIATALRDIAIPKEYPFASLDIVHGIALKQGTILAPSLTRLVRKVYEADMILSDDLRTEVNRWVSDRTQGKIPTLLSDNTTDLALLNGVCLAFEWAEKFKRPGHGWAVEEFSLASGETAPVSMMRQEGTFSIFRGETFDMLRKSYLSPDGHDLYQLIFLPHDPKDLADLEKHLTDAEIRRCEESAVREYGVQLSMPKIRMESEFQLEDLLKEMGVPLDDLDRNIIFNPRFHIGAVVHKTVVSTDEEGTEAIASADVTVERSLLHRKEHPPKFEIRHSYVYLIKDGDHLLFRGRVSDKTPLVVDR